VAGGAPASELGGAMDGQPWELLLRRVGKQGEATSRRGAPVVPEGGRVAF
jgi:hypothetical protein